MSLVLAAGLPLAGAGAAWGQGTPLRIATWNISNYGGGRGADIQTSVYGSFGGRSMSPDIILGQEWTSSSALTQFVSILNTAPGSPGDWAAAPWRDGADTESVMVYRTGRVQFVKVTTIAVGSGDATNHPRNVYRYDVRPAGYTGVPASLAMYNSHMKAGETASDQARRVPEAQRIRDNAQGLDTNPLSEPNDGLPAGWNFLLAGDFNIQESSQAAYVELVASQANNTGRFFDPINTPGAWNNNGTFRFVHTQDPAGGGGMDDRLDQILVSASLRDGVGLDYIGSTTLPYSSSTWNDPNHSYRCWGNDGTSYNTTLKVTGNTMVGPTIAQALINVCVGSGHLPVYAEFRVPGKLNTQPGTINFGTVPQGGVAQATVTVQNAGNTTLWGVSGVAGLVYSLLPSSGFTAPAGSFTASPGAAGTVHTLTMDTSTPGIKTGTVSISSNDPDTPSRVIVLQGTVAVNNNTPAAAAGPDQLRVDVDNALGEVVRLDGSGSSDSDGTITNYRWSIGATTLANGPTPVAYVTLPVGDVTVTLTVTDDDLATATDTLLVSVTPGPACGADFTLDTTLNDDDLGAFITAYFESLAGTQPTPASSDVSGLGWSVPCEGGEAPYDVLGYRADFTRDCSLNDDDLGAFITAYFNGCE